MKKYLVLPAHYYQKNTGKYSFDPFLDIIIEAENETDLMNKIVAEHSYLFSVANGIAWREIKGDRI